MVTNLVSLLKPVKKFFSFLVLIFPGYITSDKISYVMFINSAIFY